MFQELAGSITGNNIADSAITCGYYCYQFCASGCDTETPQATSRLFELADVKSFIED